MSEAVSRPAFVVIAEFKVKPGQKQAFLAVAYDDALHSLRDEPGCRQFDVICLQGEGDTVVFYEIYDSRAAFDAHLETPHLARFREAYPPLVEQALPARFADRYYP